MGIIRKTASISTLGVVKFTSRREAQTKAAQEAAKLSKEQAKLVKQQRRAEKHDRP